MYSEQSEKKTCFLTSIKHEGPVKGRIQVEWNTKRNTSLNVENKNKLNST